MKGTYTNQATTSRFPIASPDESGNGDGSNDFELQIAQFDSRSSFFVSYMYQGIFKLMVLPGVKSIYRRQSKRQMILARLQAIF